MGTKALLGLLKSGYCRQVAMKITHLLLQFLQDTYGRNHRHQLGPWSEVDYVGS